MHEAKMLWDMTVRGICDLHYNPSNPFLFCGFFSVIPILLLKYSLVILQMWQCCQIVCFKRLFKKINLFIKAAHNGHNPMVTLEISMYDTEGQKSQF